MQKVNIFLYGKSDSLCLETLHMGINAGVGQQQSSDQRKPRSLFSIFVIRFLESVIFKLSVAEETGLSLALPETRKAGFVSSTKACIKASIKDIDPIII